MLEVVDLTSGYGRLPVLHSVSVTVGERETVAVLGPNGAGKSTLLKTMARHLPVMQGKVSFDGTDLSSKDAVWAARAGIGYVPQTGNVFPDLTVAENLEISTWKANGPSMEEIYERVPVLFERRGQYASSLSGGERQMLAISSAILGAPKLLLLDEPTTGLSPIVASNLIDLITDVVAQGAAVVWVVEQMPQPVLKRANRVYVLDAGQVKFEGEAASLLAEGRLEALFLEHPQADALGKGSGREARR